MELKSSPKIFGNYKCDYPENTVKKIKNGLEKIGLNLSYSQKEILSTDFSSYYGELLIEDLGFLTCGKGTSSILAKASAYAEMAERISSGFFVFHTITNKIEEHTKLLEDVIERKFLKGYVHDKKNRLANLSSINRYVDDKISNENFNILKDQGLFDVFVDGFSFVYNEYKKIPVGFVEVISGSTGLAAGNTIEEALVQGTCEIFERYAAHRILSEKIKCPTIPIDSIKDRKIFGYANLFNSMNIDVTIKDFSLNKELPVIGVVFTNNNIENDENEFKKDLYYKMIDVGSHPDINQAILRCFIERLQGVTKEEFMYRKKSDILYYFWTKTLGKKYIKSKEISKDFFIDYEACGDLSFLEKGGEIQFDELKNVKNNDCLDDCKFLIETCAKNNFDLQVIDYTHKTLKFPALRVIIPPLSTSHDPYILKALEIENFEERINFLYEIKNLYKYLIDDSWLNEKQSLQDLIINLEEFLSKNLISHRFLIRQGHFLYPVNLFRILAFSNFALGNYDDALKYLNVLLKLKDKPPFYSAHFNILLNPGYDPVLFSIYKKLIIQGLKNYDPPIFNFSSNPFKPKGIFNDSDTFFDILLNNLRRSFFV